MRIIEGLIEYLENPIGEIIEAVVTNNLGFKPDRDRPFSNNSGRFNYIDCRKLSYNEAIDIDPDSENTGIPIIKTEDPDYMNLHWHLHKMEIQRVLNWYTEEDRRLPKYSKMEFGIIEI